MHLLEVTNRHSEGMNIDVGFQEWELTPLHVQKADFKMVTVPERCIFPQHRA